MSESRDASRDASGEKGGHSRNHTENGTRDSSQVVGDTQNVNYSSNPQLRKMLEGVRDPAASNFDSSFSAIKVTDNPGTDDGNSGKHDNKMGELSEPEIKQP